MFHAVNTKSALKLAHVRGVALLLAAESGLPIAEYSPLSIKMSVSGYGRADKQQVQLMVRSLLRSETLGICFIRCLRCAGRRHLSCDAGRLSGSGEETGVKTAALLFCFVCVLDAQVPALTFTKDFPRSVPPYSIGRCHKTGAFEYKEAVNDEQPVKAQMPASDSAALFDLAHKLDVLPSAP